MDGYDFIADVIEITFARLPCNRVNLESKERIGKFCLLCPGARHLQLCATTNSGSRVMRSLNQDGAVHNASVYVN
jgi:hypothetical protein